MTGRQQGDQARLLQARQRLDKLTWVLDDAFAIPGTRFRFGLDPIIGLLPGVGDLVGAGLSMYLIAEAARLGAPKSLLVRMFGNMFTEVVIGLVPLVGDLFDFYWKANSRNRDLLIAHIDGQLRPEPVGGVKRLLLIVLVVVTLLVLFLFYQDMLGLV